MLSTLINVSPGDILLVTLPLNLQNFCINYNVSTRCLNPSARPLTSESWIRRTVKAETPCALYTTKMQRVHIPFTTSLLY